MRAVLTAACLGFGVVQVDVSVVNIGLPQIGRAFAADLGDLQWVINSYALTFSAILLLGGSWADSYGAKAIFSAGFIMFSLSSIGCGIAHNLPMLIGMRILQGVGAALILPCALSLIRLGYDDLEARRAAIAIFGASGGIGMAAGPLVGGIMIEYWGWRSVFLINVPIGVLAMALILKNAASTPGLKKPMSSYSQISIALGVATFCFAVTEASTAGWRGDGVAALFIALGSAMLFCLVERRIAHPMLPGRLFRNPITLTMLLAGIATNLPFFGTIFGMSLYFQNILHFTVAQTGLSFVPMTAVLAAASLVSARIGKHISGAWILSIGFGMGAIGFVALSQILVSTPILTINLILMLIGAGTATATPSMMNMMISSVSHHDAGIASGLMSSARQLGGVIGVAMFGSLIDYPDALSFLRGLSTAVLLSGATLLI